MNNKIQHFISCLCLMAGLLMALPAFAEFNITIVPFDENFDRSTPVYGIILDEPEQNSSKKSEKVHFTEAHEIYDHGPKIEYDSQWSVEVNAKNLTVKRAYARGAYNKYLYETIKFLDMPELKNGARYLWFNENQHEHGELFIMASDKDYPKNLGLIVKDNKPFRIEYSKRGNVGIPDFTTPEAADYTLINTKKLVGTDKVPYEYNCEIFAEGVVRVDFGDGGFAVFPEDLFRKDMKTLSINEYSNVQNSIGDWQITKNGVILKNENGEVSKTYPNGLKEILENGAYDNSLYWSTTGSYHEDKPSLTHDNQAYQLVDSSKSEPMKWARITQEDYKFPQLYTGIGSEGYLYGDRLYRINSDYQLIPVVQIVDNLPIPIACTDTIVSVEKNLITKKKGVYNNEEYQEYDLKINYKNGDYIQTSGADIIAGSIHRNGGVLTLKKANDKLITTLTFPNGDKYVGTFAEYNSDNDYRYKPYLAFQLSELGISDIVFKDGTLIKQDGATLEYIGGKNEQQIAEERKAKAEREKAADAMATAEYNKLCQQYGKKYVDAAYGLYQPLVGMPEGLLKKALNLKLVETGNNYTLYRVLGWGVNHFGSNLTNAAILYSVWVSNGKVTHVKKW